MSGAMKEKRVAFHHVSLLTGRIIVHPIMMQSIVDLNLERQVGAIQLRPRVYLVMPQGFRNDDD